MNKNKPEEKQEAIRELKELFKKANYKAYTILRRVSTSGMFRLISVMLIIDNEPLIIDWNIAKAGIYKRDKKEEGLRVSGCGMDMGFDVVYTTSNAVFTDEKENEELSLKLYGEHQKRKDGGYIVSQRWI